LEGPLENEITVKGIESLSCPFALDIARPQDQKKIDSLQAQNQGLWRENEALVNKVRDVNEAQLVAATKIAELSGKAA
jgi:hypothetical protein